MKHAKAKTKFIREIKFPVWKHGPQKSRDMKHKIQGSSREDGMWISRSFRSTTRGDFPHFSRRNGHVIRFSELVDLWVIKTKKPMSLCARSTSRSREQNTQHRSSSENMRRVRYFNVKITEFYDYQTRPTHLFETFRSCVQRFMDFFS